jgi:regulatory protein
MTKDKPFRRRERTAPRPLTAQTLTDVAYFYAARYAVTEGRLRRYLATKLRERGWADETQASEKIDALVARLIEMEVVNDAAIATSTVAAAKRKGLAGQRVRAALAVKQVRGDVAQDAIAADAEATDGDDDAPLQTALRFAQRKRLGAWRTVAATPERLKKETSALIRAGHSYAVTRQVLALILNDDFKED